MQLRQLEYFQAASRFKSITKAAAAVNVEQPSVTAAIKKLEYELGVQLFDRTSKQIELTPEGRIFLQRVDDILNRINYSVQEMSDLRLANKGFLKIGITPIIGAMIFPYIFDRLKSEYPNIDIKFVEEGSLAIRSLLEKGDIDLGILIISNAPSPLETRMIASSSIHLCLPANHPLDKFTSVSFNELKEYPFILFKEDTYSRRMILDECDKNQFTPNIAFSTSQIETVLGLVEQGVGISFLPETIVKKHSRIQSRPLASPLSIQIGLAWHRNRYQSNAAKAFVDFIAKNF